MIYIQKGKEPIAFTRWKKKHQKATYNNLHGKAMLALRNALLQEQGFICCFCGRAIGKINLNIHQIIQKSLNKGDEHNISNAHIVPQSKDPLRTLDYNNICASCDTRKYSNEKHCDAKQGGDDLPISPLQKDCLSFFSFNSDGTIKANHLKPQSDQQKATDTIETLGLNDSVLNLEREKRINMLQILPEEEFENAINRLAQRRSNGEFEAFYFVPLSYYGKI